ncbi:hypothetical protein HpDR134_06660 [Helicobacter pylori]
MVEVRFFGPIKEENFFIKANDLKELRAILQEKEGLKEWLYVPTAILSRQSAGIRNKSLIINLPGKPKSIRECLEAVFPAIPYCVDLILGNYMQVNEKNIQAFRPKQ